MTSEESRVRSLIFAALGGRKLDVDEILAQLSAEEFNAIVRADTFLAHKLIRAIIDKFESQ